MVIIHSLPWDLVYTDQKPVSKRALENEFCFSCQAEWKILFDFVKTKEKKRKKRQYGMGGNTVVSEILQSLV